MTKIAIKGPVTGLGTYTLRAPETADTLELELPLVGTHIAGAQADGMPLGPGGDPVVESGSNTDGEWTRWADGTQQCISRTMSTTTNTPFGGMYRSSSTGNDDWAYPIPFTVTPQVNMGVSNFTGFLMSGAPAISAVTVVGVSSSTSVNVSGTLLATGRWK